MLYRISVTERGLTGIANIFRSRLSRLDDLLGAGTVPLTLRMTLEDNFKVLIRIISIRALDHRLPGQGRSQWGGGGGGV